MVLLIRLPTMWYNGTTQQALPVNLRNEVLTMTREEAYALIADLTPDEKHRLLALLLSLRQNQQPAAPLPEKDQPAD